MRQIAAFALIVVFAVCLVHFYYAEDHCPVHCPSRGGQLGHAHPHHPGASVCLCFWSSLMAPEADGPLPEGTFLALLIPAAADQPLVTAAEDVTPPPRALSV
jgi:hypothetical protein